MDSFLVMLAAFVGVCGCFLTSHVANARGRTTIAWFLIAFVTTPPVALLALAALPNERRDLPKL